MSCDIAIGWKLCVITLYKVIQNNTRVVRSKYYRYKWLIRFIFRDTWATVAMVLHFPRHVSNWTCTLGNTHWDSVSASKIEAVIKYCVSGERFLLCHGGIIFGFRVWCPVHDIIWCQPTRFKRSVVTISWVPSSKPMYHQLTISGR